TRAYAGQTIMLRMRKGETLAIIALWALCSCAPVRGPAHPRPSPTAPDTDAAPPTSALPADTEPAPAGPGSARLTAVEVCMPEGERAYLERLRCPDGVAPAHRRAGSVGA